MPALEQEEWDFNSISVVEAADAVKYEYARSNPIVRNLLVGMLKRPVRDWLTKKHKLISLKQALSRYPNFPPDFVVRIPLGLLTDQTGHFALIFNNPDFPLPYLKQKRIRRQEEFIEPFSVVDVGPENRGRAFYISGQATLKDVLKSFQKWLKANHSFPDRRGIRKTNSLAELRRLGAYRLSQAKFTFNEAQELLARHYPKHSGNDDLIIPRYASPGAWATAVEGAKRAIEGVFQPFHETNIFRGK